MSEGRTNHLAKLSMPRLAEGIPRPRLYGLLDEARAKAAVWIVAPGGAGKTTLTTTYITERKLPFLWYQLDADDGDPATFFYYLGIAVRNAVHEEINLPLLTAEYLSDIPGFARRYFRNLFALLPHGTLLVFDNHQDIAHPDIVNEILRCAIGEVPEGGNIIVISRVNPPPELTRLQVIGALSVLTWESLRLTLEETTAITSRTRRLEPHIIQTLHTKSEGWVAGLILLLEHINIMGLDDQIITSGSLENVFHFFASEFFDHLQATTRDFLLRTSLLSHMTPALAASLSENGEADQILTWLHKQHFFINRRDLPEVNYQYHALFREFLLAKSKTLFTGAQYRMLTHRAATLLAEQGRHEEVVVLYLQAQEWETATRVILEQAPLLLGQGRVQIVAGWIQHIPAEHVTTTPWLLYWRGVSQQFVNPFAARSILEQAFAGFVAMEDTVGQLLTACTILDIIFFLRESMQAVTPWIDVLQNYLMRHPFLPEPKIEARIVTSLVSMLMYIRPQDPQLPQYALRIVALLDSQMEVNQKVWMTGHMLFYYNFIAGDTKSADRIMTRIRPLLDSPDLTLINQIYGRHMYVVAYLFAGKNAEATEINRPVAKLVKDNNLRLLEYVTHFHEVLILLHSHNAKAAQPLLDHMTTLVDPAQGVDMAWHHFVKCLYAQAVDDHPAIFNEGLSALQAYSRLGLRTLEMEVSYIMAIECCKSGKPDEARNYLAIFRSEGLPTSPRMRHQITLIEAYIALSKKNYTACHKLLREALAMGKSHHYNGGAFWLISILPSLCAEALRAGIEIGYVQRLIRERDLLPANPGIEHWPWPIRIYSLGKFRLLAEGQANPDETHLHHKPLKLLEILIALGGSEVKEELITDILWPEAEGDAAHSAFTTTLFRLRKLLGEDFIKVKKHRVSLDKRRCWIDIDELEFWLNKIDLSGFGPMSSRDFAEKLLTLYRAPFLSDEDEEWPRKLRHRLQTKFSRCFLQCCRVLYTTGEKSQAVRLLERVIEADPDGEKLYRALLNEYKS